MYMVKVSHGYVDEPEPVTAEILGTYETWGEATEAAKDKFTVILDSLRGNADICVGDIAGSQYDYHVTYGDSVCKSGRVTSGYDYYYRVSVVERY